MSRIKRGTGHVKRRRNLLKLAKGYRWQRKSHVKAAKVAVKKAGVYAYRDRRAKKRDFRKLWQVRINAAVRMYGMSYSKFIAAEKKAGIILDRKILAEIAMNHPEVFEKIVASIKS